MVELRKRPSREQPTSPPPAKRGSGAGAKVKKLADKAKAAVTGGTASENMGDAGAANARAPASDGDVDLVQNETGVVPETTGTAGGETSAPITKTVSGDEAGQLGKESVGTKIHVSAGSGFGGRVMMHDGKEVSLGELVEESQAGVVVFTYPKASTPGCTTQACLFRDSYAPVTGAGLAVYGLSTDSEKSNTTFVQKNSLPYPLLCDPAATLTSAIGMKKAGPGKSTTRGVVIIDKQGTVKLWEQAGPQKTLDAVLDYIKTEGMTETGAPAAVAAPPATDPTATEAAAKLAAPPVNKLLEAPLAQTPTPSEQDAADTAAEVGEVAAKVDSAEEARA